MSLRPRLSRLRIWKRHEELVLSVFREALRMLQDDPPSGSDENAINRALYLKVVSVLHRRIRAGEASPHLAAPTWEGQNPPSPITEGTGAESKRPDFYWGYIDTVERDAERAVRNLVIECKRLGRALRSWDLNRNYVHNGVVRFIDPAHSYGKDATSGAMIGYIQNMSVSEILDIVNQEAAKVDLPALDPRTSEVPGLSELGQALNRTFDPVDFTLYHIWADIRIDVDPLSHASPNSSETVNAPAGGGVFDDDGTRPKHS